jgi:endonuclease/exonuclease/phosphatase family metal-dependent hydrolase
MTIRVLQWNIYWKQELAPIVDFMKSLDADVICLQEVMKGYPAQYSGDSAVYIMDSLGSNAAYTYVPNSSMPQGNGIFSKYPIKCHRQSWISQTDESRAHTFDNEYRSYDEATIVLPVAEITVGTTHMSYTHGFIDTPQKRVETDILMGHIKSHSKGFLLCGDFNAPEESYTIEQLKNRFVSAGPNNSQKTWTTKPFDYNGFVESNLNWRLDHVFVTPDVRVVSSKIIETDLSDHLPILVELEL